MVYKIGHITSVDPAKGLAKVKFDADNDIVSGWLPILQTNTLSNKESRTFDVNEHVVVMMDENCEDGVIMGAIYSDSDTPPGESGKDIWMKTFNNGTKIKVDRSSNEIEINVGSGKVKITGDVEIAGKLKVSSDIESTTGSIEAKVGEVTATGVKLTVHTHMIQAVASIPPVPPIPSGPPVPTP